MRRAPISRVDLEAGAGPNLAKDVWHKPELRPIRCRGVECLAKDYARRLLLWRLTVGRFSISREASIYAALAGLDGIPRCFGRIDASALLIERIDGTDARTVPPGGFPPDFFDRLEELVRSMHARGIVHGDLRQRRNILVDRRGAPWLVDFTSGVRLPPGSFPLRLASIPDRAGVAKLRRRHAPETLTVADRRLLSLDRLRPFRMGRLARRRRRALLEK